MFYLFSRKYRFFSIHCFTDNTKSYLHREILENPDSRINIIFITGEIENWKKLRKNVSWARQQGPVATHAPV